MILVDTNVVIHLIISGLQTPAAEALYMQDPEWVSPPLILAEVRNVLITWGRTHQQPVSVLNELYQEAEAILIHHLRIPDPGKVVSIAHESRISAYDAEYVALAMETGLPLVTLDKLLLTRFPNQTQSLDRWM